MSFNKLVHLLKAGGLALSDIWKKHGTSILTGMGIGGMLGGGIIGVLNTPKAIEAIQKKKEELQKDKLTVKETAETVWKFYIIPVGLAMAGGGCVICAVRGQSKTIMTLTTALSLSEASRTELLDAAKEVVGEKKIKEIEQKVDEDLIKKANIPEPPADLKAAVNESRVQPVIEAITGQLLYMTVEDIRRAEYDVNAYRFINDGEIPMNYYLSALKAKESPVGDKLGWFLDPESKLEEDMFRIKFSSQLLDDGTTVCLVIRPMDVPYYNYINRQ